MKFDLAEKLAMVHIIDSVIVADGKIHKGEINALGVLMKILDFDSNFLVQARTISIEQSISILKNMPDSKKRELAVILEEVALSDGFVHEKENEIMTSIFQAIGIKNSE